MDSQILKWPSYWTLFFPQVLGFTWTVTDYIGQFSQAELKIERQIFEKDKQGKVQARQMISNEEAYLNKFIKSRTVCCWLSQAVEMILLEILVEHHKEQMGS